jgi:predicted lipoprotein
VCQAKEKIKADIQALQAALAVAEATVSDHPADNNGPSPEKLPDPILLRVSAANLVAMDALVAVLLPKQVSRNRIEIEGGKLSRRFAVKFTGEFKLAKRRAQKALDSLNNSGELTQLRVQKPKGGEETNYISKDKMGSSIGQEKAAEVLAELLA